MYVFLSTRTIVKTYGPVGVPMVMVREGTDQMDKFDIHRAPTISEDGLQGPQRYCWRRHNTIVLHNSVSQIQTDIEDNMTEI